MYPKFEDIQALPIGPTQPPAVDRQPKSWRRGITGYRDETGYWRLRQHADGTWYRQKAVD